ncbi:MAG: cation diffusion facilitator family transporter [Bacteroides sp.]|nr:cation diffusion facilitator family transporter [Bacteroides sp.]
MEQREKVLTSTSWVSTIGNAVLSLAKVSIGLLSGSLAVLSDGIDSATDVVISVVMLITARIVSRPPDRKYVYGYEKAEGIATKVLSLVIFYAGMQLLISSAGAIFSSEPREIPSVIAIWVTLFSIAGKWGLAFYQGRQGKKIQSSLLIANARNMRNDVLISVGVLLGLFFTFILRLPVLDAVTGCFISLFIMKSAISIFMESNVDLMDGVRDEAVYTKIFDAVSQVPGAFRPHRVRSRQVGNLLMISMDIEVDGQMTVLEAHHIASAVETNVRSQIRDVYDIVVHIEPLGQHHSDPEGFGITEEMI